MHDANDNVTKITDPAGNVIDDVFDDLNRNTSRTVTLATGFLGTTSESRTYDALNRITVNRDNDYKLAYKYAEIGLTSFVYEEEQSYWGGTAYPKTVKKTYDVSGNRKTEVYPAGANLTLHFTNDSINQLSTITDGTNTIASYTYIGLRKKDTTYQSTAVRKNTYTGFRSELQSVKHETNLAVSIVRLDYGYNKVHDRTYERFGAVGAAGDAFDYDKLRRLTRAWMGSSTPSSPLGNTYTQTIDYNYDDDGNRTSVVTTPYQQAAQTTNYTTNNLYEYTAVGGTTHVWDGNGNLTDNGTFKFKYNYKNLIVEVRLRSDSSVVAEYMYGAEGRRVQKDVGGTKERYIRSRIRENSTNERPGKGKRYDMAHVVAVYDGSNVWQQNFVWNDETDGVQMLEQKDLLDYDTDGNTTELTRSYYHRNALGSVMEITDASQVVVVSYRYDPYGNVTITRGGQTQTTDPLGQHWVFTGRFNDEETSLYYYRARYYDPEIGRFIVRDPLGYWGGPNMFQYAKSSPAAFSDPLGLAEFSPSTVAKGQSNRAVDLTNWVRRKRRKHPNNALYLCYEITLNRLKARFKKDRVNKEEEKLAMEYLDAAEDLDDAEGEGAAASVVAHLAPPGVSQAIDAAATVYKNVQAQDLVNAMAAFNGHAAAMRKLRKKYKVNLWKDWAKCKKGWNPGGAPPGGCGPPDVEPPPRVTTRPERPLPPPVTTGQPAPWSDSRYNPDLLKPRGQKYGTWHEPGPLLRNSPVRRVVQ